MNEHLPEPLIYAAWIRELQNELIRDDLGPLADEPLNLIRGRLAGLVSDFRRRVYWLAKDAKLTKEVSGPGLRFVSTIAFPTLLHV